MSSFVVLATAASLMAGVPLTPPTYTMMCQAEQSVGFNWHMGEWKRTSFTRKTHLIAVGGDCIRGGLPAPSAELRDLNRRTVCVNEREIGQKIEPLFTRSCEEVYTKPKGRDWQITLECQNTNLTLLAHPDGEYRRSNIRADFSPDIMVDRDSLLVEVGKCSVVK